MRNTYILSSYPHIILTWTLPWLLTWSIYSVFIHNPICLLSHRMLSSVKNKWFLRSNPNPIMLHKIFRSWSFPIPISCCSIWSFSIFVLSVSLSEDIPDILSLWLILFCNNIKLYILYVICPFTHKKLVSLNYLIIQVRSQKTIIHI